MNIYVQTKQFSWHVMKMCLFMCMKFRNVFDGKRVVPVRIVVYYKYQMKIIDQIFNTSVNSLANPYFEQKREGSSLTPKQSKAQLNRIKLTFLFLFFFFFLDLIIFVVNCMPIFTLFRFVLFKCIFCLSNSQSK